MRTILVTGGTVFVSRYVAEYFAKLGDKVYVLNRGTKQQPEGTTLIKADRSCLGDVLKGYDFDAVLDITSYTSNDVQTLANALGSFRDYVFISSSAVYPETTPQPFTETQPAGPNSIWGQYGIGKLEAEAWLTEHIPQAYILRPPYLYGPGQNIYREGFVFDCAEQGRPFFIPKDGKMPLQFFHVEDLCRFIQLLLEKKPQERIYNVGNPETVSIRDWVKLCYEAAGMPLKTVNIGPEHPQRAYFCFHDYGYRLDVSRQSALMPQTKPLAQGLRESYEWYCCHRESVNRKPYLEYIDAHFEGYI